MVHKIKLKCQNCSKIFEDVKSREDKAKYCSRKCYLEYIRTHSKLIDRICLYCGKKFKSDKYHINKGEGKYCSHSCAMRNRETKILKKNCKFCGKKFYYYKRERKYETQYCSRRCYAKDKKDKPQPYNCKPGIANPNWRGGSSFKPYTIEFNNKLKEQIRKRDNYICQKCGKTQEKNGRKLDVHHIDYNKENCNPSNLIALCNYCNPKVNANREYWKQYFQNLIHEFSCDNLQFL